MSPSAGSVAVSRSSPTTPTGKRPRRCSISGFTVPGAGRSTAGTSWSSCTWPPSMDRDAYISECGKYRYWLMRGGEPALPCLDVVLLNPSKADATVDDATIRRLVGFATRRGYGSIRVFNLFAYRATNPKELLGAEDPIGPDNDRWLEALRGTVLCAWGNTNWATRAQHVTKILRGKGCELVCLSKTTSGNPKHP